MARWFACFVALALCALVGPSGAQAQGGKRPAGYVTAVEAPDHEGKPGAMLMRDGQEYDVQIWTPLFAGDLLHVRGAGFVTIETTKDKRQRIDASKSPHRIEGETPAGSRFAGIASTIGDLFKSKPANNAVNLVGRNTLAPTVRIGGSARQQVVSGSPVWIAWQGGVGPFTIEIRGQTSSRKRETGVLASMTSQEREALLSVPASASGALSLVITDALKQSASILLRTISPPVIPQELIDGAPSPEFAKVAGALHMLRQKNHALELYAGAHIAGIKDYPPAAALLARIAEGRAP